MSARFQGLVNPVTGQVPLSVQAAAIRPPDTVDFRGMAISGFGQGVYAAIDTGQTRVFQDGIALEEETGFVLISTGPVANISMGGLAVDANGAVVFSQDLPDVIHQGVGLLQNGELSVESACGPELVSNWRFEDWTDPAFPDDWDTGFTPDAGKFVEENADGMRYVSDATSSQVNQVGILTIGVEYTWEVEIHSVTSGNVKLQNGATLIGTFGFPGVYGGKFTAVNSSINFRRNVTPMDVVIRSCSFKVCTADP